jgi:hypothetical protein
MRMMKDAAPSAAAGCTIEGARKPKRKSWLIWVSQHERRNTMKHLLLICLATLLACLVACDQVKAPKGVDPKPYLTVLEKGLTKHHDFERLPQGQITIMNAWSSAMESGDANAMRFPLRYLEHLQRAEKDGLLRLAEKRQDVWGQLANQGARLFSVTPTEKLRQMADPKESDEKWLAVPIGTIKVLEIMSEEPCKLKRATPGDEFRLVLGLISDTPTQQVKALGPEYGTIEPQKLKFRAILQFNPFDKSYTYHISDCGKPSEAGWNSEYVAQIIAGERDR